MKAILLTLMISICGLSVNAQTDCVRGTPESILRKNVFSSSGFKLSKSKENPDEQIGKEIVQFYKNTKLTISNLGCEYYTLLFSFELSGSPIKLNETKLWYSKAVELMTKTKRGIRSTDLNLINRGTNALNSYLKKTKRLKFDHDIDFVKSEIRNFVFVSKPKKKGLKQELEITYSVGPL